MKGGGDHMRDDRSLMGWFVPLPSSDPSSLITEDEGWRMIRERERD